MPLTDVSVQVGSGLLVSSEVVLLLDEVEVLLELLLLELLLELLVVLLKLLLLEVLLELLVVLLELLVVVEVEEFSPSASFELLHPVNCAVKAAKTNAAIKAFLNFIINRPLENIVYC